MILRWSIRNKNVCNIYVYVVDIVVEKSGGISGRL